MSEQSTAYYREEVTPRAISTAQLLGQVMFLVAVALGFCALGTLIGRDLSLGTARAFSFAGSQHFDKTTEGDAASFDYAWSYSITIQRVP